MNPPNAVAYRLSKKPPSLEIVYLIGYLNKGGDIKPQESSPAPQQALDKLLSGSGLRYQFVAPDAVKIEAAPAPVSKEETEHLVLPHVKT